MGLLGATWRHRCCWTKVEDNSIRQKLMMKKTRTSSANQPTSTDWMWSGGGSEQQQQQCVSGHSSFGTATTTLYYYYYFSLTSSSLLTAHFTSEGENWRPLKNRKRRRSSSSSSQSVSQRDRLVQCTSAPCCCSRCWRWTLLSFLWTLERRRLDGDRHFEPLLCSVFALMISKINSKAEES